MKSTIQITDDLYDHFLSQAEEMQRAGQSVTAEEVMADRLSRFKEVLPTDRIVVIDPKNRARLEALFGGGSLQDAPDLVSRVEKLADVRIGEIRIDFTNAEVRRLHNWAKRAGRPVEALIKETTEQIRLHLFDFVQD